MCRPSLRIDRATPADLPSLASVYRRAFSPGVITRYCWSDVSPSGLDKWFIKRFTGVFEKREKGDKVEVLVAKRGEKVVAMAYYSIETESGKLEKDEETKELPEGADVERTKDLFGQVERLVKGINFARCGASSRSPSYDLALTLFAQPGMYLPSRLKRKGRASARE